MVNVENGSVSIAEAAAITLEVPEDATKVCSLNVLSNDPASSNPVCSNDEKSSEVLENSHVHHDEDASSSSEDSRVGSEIWQNQAQSGLFKKVDSMVNEGLSLPIIIKTLFPHFNIPVDNLSDTVLYGILCDILDREPKRDKLPQYNTLEDAIELFKTRKNIMLITGAGVSVSCGIPDFRSKDGIYARLHVDFPDLPDPTAMFDIRYFRQNPAPFYDFAKEIFPGQFQPSVSHKFIKLLEDSGRLLRNYTQNIDTLEKQTGITKVIECHGSFSKATCLRCQEKFDGEVIREDVMQRKVATCPACKEGVIKPDIVFFGEDLGQQFHQQMGLDKNEVDLLVVIGSSMKVRPVCLIPYNIAPDVPQILINREPLSTYRADIELLGNCDDIVSEICLALGGQFSEMIDSDNAMRKRYTEFEKMMLEEDKSQEDEEEEGKEEEDCPAKRMRLVSPQEQQKIVASMYQRRYVTIEKELPPDGYFQVSINRSVFPGAELVYDLDSKCVCRLPAKHYDRYDSDDDSDDDDSSDASTASRCFSEPALANTEVVDVGRSNTCLPDMHFDTSEPVPPTDFRNIVQDLADHN
ncbi:unnamed protein product [Caenorhabditis auriculariae]|uniref:NAD-dependent protein deacetylase sir-2.1 n=1 Tax=Caenorhabditis auriculariae TaxID=2777116 RepID=A0A8S1HPZ5_9PELO|nr:unnamed protein product [Caenorhabditis auriculariae]